jgi:hypothetical protein
MEREEQWQQEGGGEQTGEGGPTGVDPADVDGPNESAPGGGDDEGDFPTEPAN